MTCDHCRLAVRPTFGGSTCPQCGASLPAVGMDPAQSDVVATVRVEVDGLLGPRVHPTVNARELGEALEWQTQAEADAQELASVLAAAAWLVVALSAWVALVWWLV